MNANSNSSSNGHNGSGNGGGNGNTAVSSQQQQQLLRKQQQQQQQQTLLRQQMRIRNTLKTYQFPKTSAEILRKYAKYPPSINFHIYENYYKFNNTLDGNRIPKNSPMIKDFLHHVLREEIPLEMSELLKDFAIRSYDGCLILQVYDHRNLVSSSRPPVVKQQVAPSTEVKLEGKPDSNGSNQEAGGSSGSGSSSKSVPSAPVTKPKTYRTLLRPTPLSLYYDLLYQSDSSLTGFNDLVALQMESEILTLTIRKLDLLVPLNGYLCDSYLQPESEYPKKVWDEKTQDYKLVFNHADYEDKPLRKLHQEEMVMHKSSEYEELMLLLSNKYKDLNESAKKLVIVGSQSLAAAAVASTSSNPQLASVGANNKAKETSTKKPDAKTPTISNPKPPSTTTSGSATGQFMRLRFIEEIRKRKEAQRAQQEATVSQTVSQAQNIANNNMGSTNKALNKQRQQIVQNNLSQVQSLIQQQQQQQQQQTQPPPPTSSSQHQQHQQQLNASAPPPVANLSQTDPNFAVAAEKQKQVAAKRAQLLKQQHLQQQQAQLQKQQQQQQQQQKQVQLPNFGNQRMSPAMQYTTPGSNMNSQPVSNIGTPVMQNRSPAVQGSPDMQQHQQQQQQQQQQQAQQKRMQQLRQFQQMRQMRQMQHPQQQQQQQQQLPQQGLQQGTGAPGQNMNTQPLPVHGQGPGQGPGPSQGQGQGTSSTLQQQQQHLFQTLLTEQEQALFKQMHQKVNTWVQIGLSGVAPNRTRLTPTQQQQALAQAKALHGQLMQKFPVYYQKLRQLQALQRRGQQGQQQMGPGRGGGQQPTNQQLGMPMNPNYSNVGGKSLPGGMNSQQASPQMMNQQMMQHMQQKNPYAKKS